MDLGYVPCLLLGPLTLSVGHPELAQVCALLGMKERELSIICNSAGPVKGMAIQNGGILYSDRLEGLPVPQLLTVHWSGAV